MATGVTYTDSSTLTSGQQTLIAGAGMAFEACLLYTSDAADE